MKRFRSRYPGAGKLEQKRKSMMQLFGPDQGAPPRAVFEDTHSIADQLQVEGEVDVDHSSYLDKKANPFGYEEDKTGYFYKL